MPGIGTIVNMAAIVAGTTAGILLKGGIPKRIEKIINSAVGVAIIFIGLSGALAGLLVIDNGKLTTQNAMMLTISLITGGVLGELLDLEGKLEKLGEKLKNIFIKNDASSATFVEGFVNASLLFCIGAMAIVGSLNDGIMKDPTILFTKSILDGVTSIIYGASMGVGVYFSAVAVGIYQGLITALSGIVGPLLSDELITNMSCVGNTIIFCIGINFIFGKKIKVGNLFMAMFAPILWGMIFGV